MSVPGGAAAAGGAGVAGIGLAERAQAPATTISAVNVICLVIRSPAAVLFQLDQDCSLFHWIARRCEYPFDRAGVWRTQLVLHLHRLHHEKRLTGTHFF